LSSKKEKTIRFKLKNLKWMVY